MKFELFSDNFYFISKRMVKNFKIRFLIISCLAVFSALSLYRYFHNFYEVIPNAVYRSNQPDINALEKDMHLYHLKSILNLRGKNFEEKWYQDEIQFSATHQIIHYDIALESKKLPSKDTIEHIIAILMKAPKPILIHCESGVDRTGFVSALALLVLNNASIDEAKKQVSWHYFVFSAHSVGKQFFANKQLINKLFPFNRSRRFT